MRTTSVALRRHDFDPIAFVFGVVFTGSGLLFLIGRFDIFNHARWLWPGLLVLLGIAVLVGARGRGSQAASAGAAVEPRPVEDAPDLDTIEPPVGPEAFRLPGWPAPGEKRPEPEAGGGTDVPEPVEVPDHAESTGNREEAPTQRLDPHAETEVIEEPPKPEPPEKG
jgi:hypothetical protein